MTASRSISAARFRKWLEEKEEEKEEEEEEEEEDKNRSNRLRARRAGSARSLKITLFECCELSLRYGRVCLLPQHIIVNCQTLANLKCIA